MQRARESVKEKGTKHTEREKRMMSSGKSKKKREKEERLGKRRKRERIMRVNGELSESFSVEVGVRQGCVMSPWLFNIYMDGCIREMKVGVCD